MKYKGFTVFEVQGYNTHNLASEEDLLVEHKDRDIRRMETSRFQTESQRSSRVESVWVKLRLLELSPMAVYQ